MFVLRDFFSRTYPWRTTKPACISATQVDVSLSQCPVYCANRRILVRTWGYIVRGSSFWPCAVHCRDPPTHPPTDTGSHPREQFLTLCSTLSGPTHQSTHWHWVTSKGAVSDPVQYTVGTHPPIHPLTLGHIQEDLNPQQHRCENLKSDNMKHSVVIIG